jgi:hypothetical protein
MPAPKGEVEDGVYRPQDGSFSVAAPAGLDIREQLSKERDYVFFAPRLFKGPVYGVAVDVQLDSEYAALSLKEYAGFSLRDAQFEKRRVVDAPLTKLHEEDVTLGDKPGLFEVYSQSPGAGKPQAFYLMYFIKTRERAAILSVTWPQDCPKCASGPEADIRAMDPELEKFVNSFRLAETVKAF